VIRLRALAREIVSPVGGDGARDSRSSGVLSSIGCRVEHTSRARQRRANAPPAAGAGLDRGGRFGTVTVFLELEQVKTHLHEKSARRTSSFPLDC
jgi:hypothetical protein